MAMSDISNERNLIFFSLAYVKLPDKFLSLNQYILPKCIDGLHVSLSKNGVTRSVS